MNLSTKGGSHKFWTKRHFVWILSNHWVCKGKGGTEITPGNTSTNRYRAPVEWSPQSRHKKPHRRWLF